jgi:predicted nucleotidyltransferase
MNKFGIDDNGFIITEVSVDKITPQHKTIVDEVLSAIVEKLTSQIGGIYLYGSVATGKAIEGKSDLDILIVLKETPDKSLSEEIKSLESTLSEKYEPMLRGVGLTVTSIPEVTSEKERYGYMCYIKHLCVCVYGNDITKDTLSFTPSKEIAKGFNGDITEVLKSYKDKIEKSTSELELKKLSQEVSKKIVRTGFSLVMPRSGSWSTDLQSSFDTFVYYYPEKAKDMNVVLEWARGCFSDKASVVEFMEVFGKWLSEEFEREILMK